MEPSKCHFFETQLTFLWHVLTPDGVLPEPDQCRENQDIARPKSCVTDVQAILGMGNYYWQFIKDYSKKMQPLIHLTKKDKSLKWTAECQKSFHQLKEALTGPGIMAYPTDDGEFLLDTNSAVPGPGWGGTCNCL